MTKVEKIRVCDWGLLAVAAAMLASGVQLEATHSRGVAAVWVHIVVGVAFMALCGWHVYLHYGRSNWFARFAKQKKVALRLLWWAGLIVLVSAVAATAHWLGSFAHSPVGGVHGKLGFAMLLLGAGHIAKRIKFFKKKC